jgi:hypothetical protein
MVEVEEDDILEYMVRLSAGELKDKSDRKMGDPKICPGCFPPADGVQCLP